jgi:phosphoribosylamine-glycine ligase
VPIYEKKSYYQTPASAREFNFSHAGTDLTNDGFLQNFGGRVPAVSAIANSLEEADALP